MAQLRVAFAQIDLTVGDLAGNAAAVLRHAEQAAASGAHLVVFPEMTLTGYPPEDLVLRPSFRAASKTALQKLVTTLDEAGLGELGVIVGYLDDQGGPRNAAAFLLGGQIVASYFKHHLPNYGVFDERRYFVPGEDLRVIRYRGVDIALTICEDLWQPGGPFAAAREAGAGLVVNINGSPYERTKGDVRLTLLARRAAEAGCAIAYVNQCGGQDELVFDGDSMVVAPDGSVLARTPQFRAGLFVVDLALPAASATPPASAAGLVITRHDTETSPAPAYVPTDNPVAGRLNDPAEVWAALVLGLRDYAGKNGFTSVVLGVSGGIDSAVTAALAADALGGDAVHGIALPSEYSSEHSLADAEDLCRRLGAHYRVVPIAPMVRTFVDALQLTGLAEENVQARVRGTTLMALSNAEGHLVLAPGNKSELAVGYSTIYGDAVGGFGPIKDVPKSLIWELARWRNADAAERGEPAPIPANSISKEPSAELRPGQLDTDSLPDYAVLDAILARYVDGDAGFTQLLELGFDSELVARIARLVDSAEWKRRQYPPGTKISFKAFGRDRRLPITNRWRESAP